MKKKKIKVKYAPDDGRTIYSMENVGNNGRKNDKEKVPLGRKEKWAAIRAAFAVYLPRLLLVIGCFIVTGLLIYLWLK